MELISVHVPKTAGVTFRTLLRTVYHASGLFLDYGDRALDPLSTFQTDPPRWREESARQAADLPPGVRVVHGHFAGAKYDALFPEARKIVWLRDPVTRLVSHYHYWRNLPPSPHSLHQQLLKENLSLLGFARLEGMRNVLANVFLRDCHLENFAFIGAQEHFAADLPVLATLLGWPEDLAVGDENRNADAGYRDTKLSDEEREEIAALNAEDVALYERALAMRRKWVKALPPLEAQGSGSPGYRNASPHQADNAR